VPGLEYVRLHVHRLRGRLDSRDLLLRAGRVPKDGHTSELRDRFAEEFEPLGAELAALEGEPRDIAAGAGKARDEAVGVGIIHP